MASSTPNLNVMDAPPIIGPPVSLDEPPVPAKGNRGRLVHGIGVVVGLIATTLNWLFGLVSIILGLSILATIPILQFLSLGYFLEASGRIVRSGRIRDGFIGIPKAARIGSIVIGSWLSLLPARFVSSLAESSLLINGYDTSYRMWRIGLIILLVLTTIHITWAWFRGGKLRHFLWPAPVRFWRRIKVGNLVSDARDATCDFIASLHLKRYFLLGLRGFVGAIWWLFVPVTLIALATQVPQPLGALSGIVGSLWLSYVVMILPFMQTRFAESGNYSELFQRKHVKIDFRRAPIAFFIALLVTLSFALPLYLLKAELIPREAAWLPSLVFVVFMFPSRIVTGWAVARARKRQQDRHFVFRWSSRLLILPTVAFYVGFVFLTQYVSWYGRWSLYEQHAFMLPVPFLGM